MEESRILCLNLDGLKRMIGMIDRVRRKEMSGKDGIHYICCKQLKHMDPDVKKDVTKLVRRHEKNPKNLAVKAALFESPEYQEIRKNWNLQKIMKLIQTKDKCLSYKTLGFKLNSDKVEEINVKDPEFMTIMQDFAFIFPKKKCIPAEV